MIYSPYLHESIQLQQYLFDLLFERCADSVPVAIEKIKKIYPDFFIKNTKHGKRHLHLDTQNTDFGFFNSCDILREPIYTRHQAIISNTENYVYLPIGCYYYNNNGEIRHLYFVSPLDDVAIDSKPDFYYSENLKNSIFPKYFSAKDYANLKFGAMMQLINRK